MSNPIRLPCHRIIQTFAGGSCTLETVGHIEIHPDIAVQIVRLAYAHADRGIDPAPVDAGPACEHKYAKTLLAPGPVARFCPDCQQSLPIDEATPPAARLIHLLIEERAKRLAYANTFRCFEIEVTDFQRDQARREVEREVLASNAQADLPGGKDIE